MELANPRDMASIPAKLICGWRWRMRPHSWGQGMMSIATIFRGEYLNHPGGNSAPW